MRDPGEARRILDDRVRGLRELAYEDLLDLGPARERVAGSGGAGYVVQVRSFYDNGRDGDLRVVVSVDDGGWSAWKPMTGGFVIAADGSFVGE